MAIAGQLGNALSGMGGSINLTAIITIILVALLSGGLLIALFVFLRYNIVVEIHSKRGGGSTKVMKDYAKIINDKGVKKLRMLRRRKDLPVPPREYFYVLKGNKEKIFFLEDISGRIHPSRMETTLEGTPFWKPEYEEEKDWFVREREMADIAYKKQSFWERYQFMIVTGAMIAFVLVVIIFTLQKYEKVAEHFSGLVRAVETYCTGGVIPR